MIQAVLFLFLFSSAQTQNPYQALPQDTGSAGTIERTDSGITDSLEFDDDEEEEDSLVFVTRSFHPATLDSLRSLADYQYQRNLDKEPSILDLFFSWIRKNILQPVLGSKPATYLILVLAAGLLVWAMLKLMRIDAGPLLFSRRENSPRIYETDEDLIRREVSLEDLAGQAEQAGAWREMIRFRFLNLLKLLDREKIIVWSPDKTNLDYVRDLSRTAFLEEFRSICSQTDKMTWSEKPTGREEAARLNEQIKVMATAVTGEGKRR